MSASIVSQENLTDHELSASRRLRLRALAGLGAGLLAGGLYWILLASQEMSPMMNPTDAPGDVVIHFLLSAILGAAFALLFGQLVTTPGSGLMWGITFGLLWWFIGPLTLFPLLRNARPEWTIAMARNAFPLLTGLAVSFGALLGLMYWLFCGLIFGAFNVQRRRQLYLAFAAALITGGLAGLIGAVLFGAWTDQAGFFPLVADLVGSDSMGVGYRLHLLFGTLIGASFGVLFRNEIRGLGSSIAWGSVYGLVWWILGPLTLMPWLLGDGVQWSLDAGRAAFAPLVGHVIYGITLGIVYSALTRLWQTLFIDSDPLNREPEGPGTRSVRALGIGIFASVIGGLVFTTVMVATNTLPLVANLIGMNSPVVGFIVHMLISAIIGATYGLLFQREAYTFGAGLAWGMVYGMVWWFLGALTLFPQLLGQPVAWSLEAATTRFPSLIGHLLYGAALALMYLLIARRYDPGLLNLREERNRARFFGHRAGTPRPALWTVVLLLGILLPLILS